MSVLPAGSQAGPVFDLHNQVSLLGAKDFFMEEPWSHKVVTNGSQHRYVPDFAQALAEGVLRFENDQFRIVPMWERGADTVKSAVLTTQNDVDKCLHVGEAMFFTATLPWGKGLWPAIWFLPYFPFGEWPEDYRTRVLPEIDVMESVNKDNVRCYYTNRHTYNAPLPGSSFTDLLIKHTCPAGYDLYQNGHTYGIYREEDAVHLTLDNMVVNSFPAMQEDIMQGPWTALVNLAVGGGWPGPFDTRQAPDPRHHFIIHDWRRAEIRRAAGKEDQKPELNPNRDVIARLNKLQGCVEAAVTECFDEDRAELQWPPPVRTGNSPSSDQ